jgi:ankyrin repeat protein
MSTPLAPELLEGFIKASTWHGPLTEAESTLAQYPQLASYNIFTAAIMGDAESVRKFIAADKTTAISTTAPYGGNALVYLSLSKYLRLRARPDEGFLQAATTLLDAGANPNSGFWTTGKHPEFETALYGAAGVAQHAGLTKLLVDRGADPNDEEAVYHSPETGENDALRVLVETGQLTRENLVMMLIRKHDWHDYEGAKYLLEHGADPNGNRGRGWYPLQHALARTNGPEMFALLLDHKADPFLVNDGLTAVARAAREGRGDVLEIFRQKGIELTLQGVDALILACATGNRQLVRAYIEKNSSLQKELVAMGGTLLAKFCTSGNLPGVTLLLDLGIPVNDPFTEGDGYFGTPPGSLAIHVAAWHNYPFIVQLLIDKGAITDAPDANGETPLMLTVKACTNSYWTGRRTPRTAAALLKAGASARNVRFPCGYAEVDNLLQEYIFKT